ARGGRPQGGRVGDGRRAAGVPRAAVREVVAARAGRVHRKNPEDERRQVPQARAARTVRDRAGKHELRAAVLPAVDAPFEVREVPDPKRGERQAVVRVRAAGLNFLDVLIRHGRYPQMPELPAVLGSELAGELEDGTRVMALVRGGAYAELANVDLRAIVPMPEGASFAEGAAFLLTFLTAYIPLTRQVRIGDGATVLVHAAAGGVGTAAIQVAPALGARVVAAVGSEEKHALCRELGADEAYVYEEIPEDLRVDVV